LAVKTYPGEEWHLGERRADYGRRGKLWVHGAFEPITGQATILTSPGRDSASHIQLVEKVMIEFPSDRWLFIEDNLVIHTSREVRLALASRHEIQIQFLPKYACWLNLIEPWWKQLKSLALKGRRFETLEQLNRVLYEALAYWNSHRHPYLWKKRPQEQLPVFGGFGIHLRSDILAI
jgi:transposase